MKIKSHCKINLFLHITGKRNDGYHELESLFYFPEIYDEIEINEGIRGSSYAKASEDRDRLEVKGRFAEPLKNNINQNIILKTYSLLKILYGHQLPELSFTLTKNIPVASGLGGGSANAAAILKALNEFYELGLSAAQLYKIGARLGADVPACILDRTCIARGIGEILTEVEKFPKLHVLIVNPLIEVSTAEIFRMGFSQFSTSSDKKYSFTTTQNLIDFLETTKNDLEVNAKKICTQINDVLHEIAAQNGCLFSRMSGSGASCFGIFETKDKALLAKENILLNNSDWWAEMG